MHTLTVDDILAIRETLAEARRPHGDPERYGIRTFNGLLSALAAPGRQAFGEVFYPTLPEQAGALVYGLIQNHPFWDGNKRIAAAALHLFLQRNGAHLAATNDQVVAFTREIARGSLRDGAVATWITRYLEEP